MTTYQTDLSVRSLFGGLLPHDEADGSRFVWLSNFDAERFWTPGNTVQLPKLSPSNDVSIVNRLEEINLFIAEDPDLLILREPSDPDFLAYLDGLGFRLPRIITANPPDKQSPISEAVLANEHLCATLRDASSNGHKSFLLPYAKTALEEQIIQKTGLQSLGPAAAICERINCKIYSRRISKELGLSTIEGRECESIEELEKGFDDLSATLSPGEKIVLKEAMGVSGKGLVVIDNQARFQRLMSLLKRSTRKGAEKEPARFAFVMEVWVEKLKDINYQIFISNTGEVTLLSLKEIIAEGGVHMGHRFPADLTPRQWDAYEEAAQAVGRRLFEDGFTGIAGLDSIVDSEGKVYPVLEINGRFNMSTYQLGLDRLIGPDSSVIAKHYSLLLDRALPFDRLREAIGTDLFKPSSSKPGVLIQNYATVNVNCDSDEAGPFRGRLYVLLAGRNFDQLRELDRRMLGALEELRVLGSGSTV